MLFIIINVNIPGTHELRVKCSLKFQESMEEVHPCDFHFKVFSYREFERAAFISQASASIFQSRYKPSTCKQTIPTATTSIKSAV